MVSAPPVSVTVLQALKLPQLPFESVASERSTITELASMPAPVSVPLSIVTGTDRVEYQGPPTRVADWPLGAVASGEIVIDAVAVAVELLVATMSWLSGLPAAPAVHA